MLRTTDRTTSPSRPSLRAPWMAAACCALFAACGGAGAEPEPAERPLGQVRGEVSERPDGDDAVEAELETLLGTTRTVEGKRVVGFQLRNRGERELEIAYRVEWMNRRGEALESDETWVLVHLPPGGAVPVEASAPTRDAESWTVRAVETGGDAD